jgi:hypothetical protein
MSCLIPVHHTARRLSVLHIFKVYYPDLFGRTHSVQWDWPPSRFYPLRSTVNLTWNRRAPRR